MTNTKKMLEELGINSSQVSDLLKQRAVEVNLTKTIKGGENPNGSPNLVLSTPYHTGPTVQSIPTGARPQNSTQEEAYEQSGSVQPGSYAASSNAQGNPLGTVVPLDFGQNPTPTPLSKKPSGC